MHIAERVKPEKPLKVPSLASVTRKHFLGIMSEFYPIKIEKETDVRPIKVGFNRDGNKHLFSDTFKRSKFFKKSDLLNLPAILDKSTYVAKAELSKNRKDKIKRFYYYSTVLRGNMIFLNVAEEVKKKRAIRYLYSITDKIKTE